MTYSEDKGIAPNIQTDSLLITSTFIKLIEYIIFNKANFKKRAIVTKGVNASLITRQQGRAHPDPADSTEENRRNL